ncbi:hypothetical protein B0H13DRAFT_2042306 [Mycena leptocephala]|nr:hypothetical protein B0H13DRAFT_2042306 [Mycena leptocephala]
MQRLLGASPIRPRPVMLHLDWIPGICSLLGFQIINLIDKDRIRGEDGHGARLSLFIGFALMAGGLAGSATVLVIKYVVPDHEGQFKYANVTQNIALMLSVVILWLAQNGSSEYEYNLTIQQGRTSPRLGSFEQKPFYLDIFLILVECISSLTPELKGNKVTLQPPEVGQQRAFASIENLMRNNTPTT